MHFLLDIKLKMTDTITVAEMLTLKKTEIKKMFYLIVNNKIVAESKNFDKLVAMADENMEGFVVSAKDWKK